MSFSSPYEDEDQDLWTAISAATVAFPNFRATAINRQSGSRYTPLNDILIAAKPILAENRLLVNYTTHLYDRDFSVVQYVRLIGTSEQMNSELHFRVEWGNAQEIASLVTYARRYLLAITFSLVLGVDDDGNATNEELATRSGPKPGPVTATSTPPPPPATLGSVTPNPLIRPGLAGPSASQAAPDAIMPMLNDGQRLGYLWARLLITAGRPAAQQALLQCAGTRQIKDVTPEQFAHVISTLEQCLSQPTQGGQAA